MQGYEENPPSLIDLLSKMMQKDPTKRIKISDVVSHPFLRVKGFQMTMDKIIRIQSKLKEFSSILSGQLFSKVTKKKSVNVSMKKKEGNNMITKEVSMNRSPVTLPVFSKPSH